MHNVVAIIGRPNVGKSTLYNRLIESRSAIVDDVSGVTRDRLYGLAEWNGKSFNVIDTGGFVPRSDDVFEAAIREQCEIAISEADIVVFMVDVASGITSLDNELAHRLRKSPKPILLAVNKVDNSARNMEAQEFYKLGFKETFFLSSISGSGTGDLLDAVVEQLPRDKAEPERDIPRLAIIGQPNVGKSSLVNALVGEQRNIVTDVAGTTRDAIHTHYKLFNKEFTLLDTAGLRKKTKVHENLEFYSVIRAIRAIDDADVCLVLIDATVGLEAQDINIFRLVERRKKGVLILVNKWDLVKKETMTARGFEEKILAKIAPFDDVPVIFVSALEKTRIHKAIETALEVYQNRRIKISTSVLNKLLTKILEAHPPPRYRGKTLRIKYLTQLPTAVPSFAFFCNNPERIKEPYKNYLENRLREQFQLNGVPINLFFRKK